MKSKWKVAYICASVSIALGLILMLSAFVAVDFDISRLSTVFISDDFPAAPSIPDIPSPPDAPKPPSF